MPDSSPEVKAAFRLLAKSIDEVGEDKTELFLAKLALMLADALNDQDKFANAVNRAMHGETSVDQGAVEVVRLNP